MYNYSYSACQQNELNRELHVLEVELGSVIQRSHNETGFWTIFTLAWTSLGIALSTAALALLILTALLFAEWRKSYKNQLLVQFMFARFFYTTVRFFSDIQNVLQICTTSNTLIFVDLLSMIYSELVLVTWMFVFSRQMYISLVKVFDTESSNIWKVSLCAWLGPAAVSLLLHLIFYVSHATNRRYYVLYLMIIKWPVLIANAVLLILVLRSVLVNNKKTENNARIIVVMIMLIFMFCFQQIIIDICKIVFLKTVKTIGVVKTVAIIGNILSMYHCAFSILFWVLGNANTRKLWQFQGRDIRGKIRLSVRFSS